MGVQRRVNWISQQRVDVPDVRAIESAGSNDFDQLIQAFVTGTVQGYIMRGFELSMVGAIGGASSALQMIVDPGALLHIAASQSGTIMLVPPGTPTQQLNSATNTIVDGAFAPNAINYVGIDYERFIDPTTQAQIYIWDPTTKSETTKSAPRAQILRYRIKISTSTWPSNVLPVAIVTTDSGNNVTSVEDSRWMFGRLGTGGASPNPFYVYPWTAQTEGRLENPSVSSSNSVNPFHGGDKMLGTLKDWMNAMMTSIKEIKGTNYWYQLGSGGSIEKLREDLGNTITTGSGTLTHSDVTPGLMNWDEDIYLRIVGSALAYKLAANPSSSDITLADGEVAYITLARDVSITPNLFYVYNSGPQTTTVTSIGAVAWTSPLAAGDFLRAAGDPDSSYAFIQSVDSISQVTLKGNYVPAGQTAAGVISVYALGTYNAVPTPSGPRDIFIAPRASVPSGQNMFWLMLRDDNLGVIPRVYVRFLGTELEQGDSDDIDDPVSQQLLQYIGTPSKAISKPKYVSALTPGSVPQITDLKCGSAATVTANQYFYIYSSARTYYVWIKKDGSGTDPKPLAAAIGLQWNVTTGQSAQQLATTLAALLSGTTARDFSAVTRAFPNDDTVRVTANSAGVTTSATNFNVPSPFAITIIQTGTGTGNTIIQDGDNLTLAIKELDDALGNLIESLNDPSYDETVDIVASGATPPTSLNGPVVVSTDITLPNNTRMGNIPQFYTVGKGALQVFLNGQYLRLGSDWAEVGAPLTASSQIQILRQLEVRDSLEFRISAGGAGSGGGGGVGPVGPPGPAGPPGADAVGGPVAISTKTSNYSVMLSDNVLLADCTGGAINFTLPLAATATGRVFFFKKIDSTLNTLTFTASGSDLIDGFMFQNTNVQYESFTLICDGTNWWLF